MLKCIFHYLYWLRPWLKYENYYLLDSNLKIILENFDSKLEIISIRDNKQAVINALLEKYIVFHQSCPETGNDIALSMSMYFLKLIFLVHPWDHQNRHVLISLQNSWETLTSFMILQRAILLAVKILSMSSRLSIYIS